MVAWATVAVACRDTTERAPVAAPEAGDAVVVASFDFSESELLAEIYAVALEEAGVPVRREPALGPRELVAPALAQGHVDLVPEYLGSAAATFADGAPLPAGAEGLHALLADRLGRRGVRVLAAAPAENQNAVVVRRSLADRLRLASVSDLVPHARSLTLSGPSECPVRPHCLVGLQEVYGLTFRRFLPLDGASRVVRALDDGVADVGVLFTTDGQLADRRLVALEDDRHLQPPEHVVPVAREETLRRHGERVVAIIDGVSARLTTTALRLLNWRVDVAGRDLAQEARGWLVRRGLIDR